eukprot:763043-Hanusia_phi.AAC.3
MKFDADAASLSFFLQPSLSSQTSTLVGRLLDVYGELVPAVCLGSPGDLVELNPAPACLEPQQATNKERIQAGGAAAPCLAYLPPPPAMLLSSGIDSPIASLSRLLQDCKASLNKFSNVMSMIGGYLEQQAGSRREEQSLAEAHRSLAEAKALFSAMTGRSNVVLVRNLARDTTEDELRGFLKECGEITRVSSCSDADFLHPDDRPKLLGPAHQLNLLALVSFRFPQSVVRALGLDKQKLRENHVDVREVRNVELDHGVKQSLNMLEREMSAMGETSRSLIVAVMKLVMQQARWFADCLHRRDINGANVALERAQAACNLLPRDFPWREIQELPGLQDKIGDLQVIGRGEEDLRKNVSSFLQRAREILEQMYPVLETGSLSSTLSWMRRLLEQAEEEIERSQDLKAAWNHMQEAKQCCEIRVSFQDLLTIGAEASSPAFLVSSLEHYWHPKLDLSASAANIVNGMKSVLLRVRAVEVRRTWRGGAMTCAVQRKLDERMSPVKQEIKALCRQCEELFARGEEEEGVEMLERIRFKQRSLPLEDVEYRVLMDKHRSRYDRRMTEWTEARRTPHVILRGIYLSFLGAWHVDQEDMAPTPFGDSLAQRVHAS